MVRLVGPKVKHNADIVMFTSFSSFCLKIILCFMAFSFSFCPLVSITAHVLLVYDVMYLVACPLCFACFAYLNFCHHILIWLVFVGVFFEFLLDSTDLFILFYSLLIAYFISLMGRHIHQSVTCL